MFYKKNKNIKIERGTWDKSFQPTTKMSHGVVVHTGNVAAFPGMMHKQVLQPSSARNWSP